MGVTRKALHESNELEKAISFHDLRDTGLTHMALRGDHPQIIQWTAGHTDQDTTQGYIDRGRVERQRIGEPLPALPLELLPDPPTGLASAEPVAETLTVSASLWRPQWELNPCYRRERPVS